MAYQNLILYMDRHKYSFLSVSSPFLFVYPLFFSSPFGYLQGDGIDVFGGVYVCIFIKLHITAQSGPVIRVILCHSH